METENQVHVEKLKLYRGDNSRIDRFDINKTNDFCLFGKGIYLTDDQKIADSYRDKGQRWDSGDRVVPTVLYSGVAKDRHDAYTKAQIAFREFDVFAMVELGSVYAEYTAKPDRVRGIPPRIEVRYKGGQQVGHRTEFHFPKEEFLSRVLDVRKGYMKTSLWERFVSEKIISKDEPDTRSKYISSLRVPPPAGHRPYYNCVTGLDVKAARRCRNVFSKEGYIGILHEGGVITNGQRHRAFVIWDHDLVNAHAVRV